MQSYQHSRDLAVQKQHQRIAMILNSANDDDNDDNPRHATSDRNRSFRFGTNSSRILMEYRTQFCIILLFLLLVVIDFTVRTYPCEDQLVVNILVNAYYPSCYRHHQTTTRTTSDTKYENIPPSHRAGLLHVVLYNMPKKQNPQQQKLQKPTKQQRQKHHFVKSRNDNDRGIDTVVYEISQIVPNYNGKDRRHHHPRLQLEYNITERQIIWSKALHIYDTYIVKHQKLPVWNNLTIKVNSRSIERIHLEMLQICIITKDVTNTISFLNNRLLPLSTHEQQRCSLSASLSLSTSQHLLSPRIWAMILKVCAITGHHQHAYDILHRMNKYNIYPNVRHCTFYLSSLTTSKQSQQNIHTAIQFLLYMSNQIDTSLDQSFVKLQLQPYTSKPDMIAIKTVLYGCHNNFTLIRALCDNVKNGLYGAHLQLDISCYNILISSCPNSTYIPDLLREIKLTRRHRDHRIYPTLITYTKAITICRKDSNIEYAKQLLSIARNEDHIKPDTFMYTAAIWVAAHCNDATSAVDIYHEMLLYNVTPSVVTYNGILSALASLSPSSSSNEAQMQYDMIVTIYRHMKQQQTSYQLSKSQSIDKINSLPNSVTFYHISRAFQNMKEDEERLAYLWRIYALMDKHDKQVKVGSRLLEALIFTYGTIGHYEEALHVFNSIQGVSDVECIRAILYACSVADPPQWEMALTILHTCDVVADAAGPGLVDSVAVCNTMLACSKAGQWEESLHLLRLYGLHCNVSIVAINSLIASCGRAGRPDISMEVLYETEGWGIKLDARSYRSAIIACNQAEHVHQRLLRQQQGEKRENRKQSPSTGFEWWECAISLLRRMKESGLQPDTSILSSTISACEAAGQWQLALYILQSAMNENSKLNLNLYCFNAALSACEKGNAWVEALEIYEKMKEKGGPELRPNAVTVSSLVLALDDAGQKEFAVSIYREGVRKRYIRSPWRTTKDTTSNESITAMDLHTYSSAMARTAIRNHVDSLLSTAHRKSIEKLSDEINASTIKSNLKDWIIIVGQGHHSIDGRPVLKDVVTNVLQLEYGINATIDEYNTGRVIVSGQLLNEYISLHRSAMHW